MLTILPASASSSTSGRRPGASSRTTTPRQKPGCSTLEILDGHAGLVAGAIRRKATYRRLDPAARAGVDRCADYLTNKIPYMGYSTALKRGWPIATGVIEGACRHLVKDRMDITGARWGLEGAEAVLQLRTLVANGDFNHYWHFHLSQQRVHLARYAPHVLAKAA